MTNQHSVILLAMLLGLKTTFRPSIRSYSACNAKAWAINLSVVGALFFFAFDLANIRCLSAKAEALENLKATTATATKRRTKMEL